ncbi:MAG: hypothetical protein ABIT10_06410 [Alteraurantiacibacter sp.]
MEPVSIIMQLAPWIAGTIVITTALGIYATHVKTRMKIQNGYPLEGMWGQSLKPTGASEHAERIKLLTQESAQLRAEMSSVKERLANVERIVTDSGFGLAEQIAALGQQADSGHPLELVASRDKTRA